MTLTEAAAKRRAERIEHWRRIREVWARAAEVDRPCKDGRACDGGMLPREAGPWVRFCPCCLALRKREQTAASARMLRERSSLWRADDGRKARHR